MTRPQTSPVLQDSPISEYLRTVSQQIRWKQARAALVQEVECHLLDQAESCEAAGMDRAAAEAEAVRQMGDPVAVGQALDEVHRPKTQWPVAAFAIALAAAGAAAQLAYGYAVGAWWIAPEKVVPFTVLGVVLMLLLHYVDCVPFLARHAKVFVGIAVGSALLVDILHDANGYALAMSSSMHNATLLFPLAFALLLYSCRGEGWKGLAVCAVAAAPMVGLSASFGDVPQLVTMLVVLAAFAAYELKVGWLGLSRAKAACAMAACVLIALVIVAATGVWDEYFRWVTVLEEPGNAPSDRYFTPIYSSIAVENAQLFGAASVEKSLFGWDSVANTGILLTELLPVMYLLILGFVPMVALGLGIVGFALWLLARTLRQRKNRLFFMAGLAVSLTFIGQIACAAAPFALGILFSGSVAPFCVPGFHNVVFMALVGMALSGFRHEGMPRQAAEEGRRYA